MLKHALKHDLVERDIVKGEALAELLKEGTKAELIAELDKVQPGHELTKKDSKGDLQAALAKANS